MKSLTINPEIKDVSCAGGTDGAITLNPNHDVTWLAWDNGATSTNLEMIKAGFYQVMLKDTNGCAAKADIQVNEPVETTISVSISQESCETHDASIQVSASGGNGNFSYFWHSGEEGTSIENLSAGDYYLLVLDEKSCETYTSYSVQKICNIPTTSLSNQDCGANGLELNESIRVEKVPGAKMYHWKLINPGTGREYDNYTEGSQNELNLAEVDNLPYNIDLEVRVRALVGNTWSEFGNACSIQMSTEVPTTNLDDTSCGLEGVESGDVLYCEEIVGAQSYKWSFVAEGFDLQIESSSTELWITEQMAIPSGREIEVFVQASVQGLWSPRTASCFIYTGHATSNPELENSIFSHKVFPNPNSGNEINIEIEKPFNKGVVTECALYDAFGKQIELIALYDQGGYVKTRHTFSNTLSSGVYILRITLDNAVLEERIVVR